MSRDLERKLAEDRSLRNAALALVRADVAQLRTDVGVKGVGSRFAGRMSEGAVDVFEEAVEVADNNRGVLATLVAAVLIWFARNPIMALFEDEEDTDGAEQATGEEPQPSQP